MALPKSFYGGTIADNTLKSNGEPETSSWEVPVADITAANYVAQTALYDALQAAIDNVNIGLARTKTVTAVRTLESIANASDTAAQRENKLLLRYHDNTTFKKFRVTIPCFDLTLLPSGSEFLPLDADEGAALKTAFEAVVKSPDDVSHAVTLDTAQFVGRNT